MESGLNQRDRATGGFVVVYTHRKPGIFFDGRGFARRLLFSAFGGFRSRTAQPHDRTTSAVGVSWFWSGTGGLGRVVEKKQAPRFYSHI